MMVIRVSQPFLGRNARRYVGEVLDSGWLSPGGPFSRRFKDALERRFNARAVLTNSGTSALEIALIAMAIVRGLSEEERAKAEVIVPAFTCPDCLMAVIKAGFRCVFADVDLNRMVLTSEHLLKALTENTVGVMPVAIYGMGCDVELYKTAREKGLFIVVDACEAFDVRCHDVPVLDFSDVVCFSLRGEKHLAVGTGGVIISRHDGLAGVMGALIGLNSSGHAQRYWALGKAYSYEYPELLSALGLAQLEDIDEDIAHRWDVVQWYEEEGIKHYFRYGDVPWKMPYIVVRGMSGERFYRLAAQRGVEVSPAFVPLHKLSWARRMMIRRGEVLSTGDFSLPNAEFLWRHAVALPLHGALTRMDVREIVKTVVQVENEQSTQ